MRFGHIVITAVIHVAAFEMALLEILLRCFRRRKQPSSEQDRPLVESRDASEEHPASDQFVDATEQLPLTPTSSERPATLALEPAPQPVAIEPQHTIVEHPDEKETATSCVTAPLTPQASVQLHNVESEPSKHHTPALSAAPAEFCTRPMLHRTPVQSRPSADEDTALKHAATTPVSSGTPMFGAQQNVSHSSTSTPSTFGLPEFLLDGGYLGLQTPQIVGMNNPVTAFKENKQLRCHETPFDARIESLMEKERVFRERFIQHKTSEAFKDAAKQANWSVSNESKLEFFSDLENTAPSHSSSKF